MDKYAQLNRFYHNLQLHVCMYALMYVDPETILVEDHFSATKKFVVNYKKMSTPGKAPKHWFMFSYIHSEYYELDNNFDDTK